MKSEATMSNHGDNRVEPAAEHWRGGRPLEAGELLFESIPREFRPNWASRILKSAAGRSGIQFLPIENMLYVADHPTQLRTAHHAFDILRHSTLELERIQVRTKDRELLLSLLLLAELVAKVIYNATDPPDPFDEDSGWWIPVCLKDLFDLLGDNDSAKSAWLELCAQEG
jgi:hypothetical protein